MASLRLAVFGLVKDGAGSVATAHYLLCRAILEAGHRLDLYGAPSYIPDPDYASLGFRYVPVPEETRRVVLARGLPRGARAALELAPGISPVARYQQRALALVRIRHEVAPYDALVFLGVAPRRRLDWIPTVVWPQCAPQNELLAVRGLSQAITRISGRRAYLKLRMYYEVRDRVAWSWTRRHHLILASEVSRRDAIDFGVRADRICVTPYPVDLARFTPEEIPDFQLRRILCVGRLDPRKRVDLLVDAVRLLARRRNDFCVEVIGSDGYLPGWRRLVEEAGWPTSYTPRMPQSQIIQRLRGADLVVQPSEREEFGFAVAEALACGVPVITGPTNRTGAYAPPEGSATFARYTPESLAEAIERGLAIARSPRARAACRRAAQAFAPDRVAATVCDFIHSLRAAN